jgi:hypothetical protein
MKLKINEILSSANSLGNIGAVKVNTALKFRLARVIKQVQEALKDVDEQKVALFKREGSLNADKTGYDFPNEEVEKRVEAELKALGKEEVEITFDKFSEDTFAKLEIASIDIANCMWLFAEPSTDTTDTPEKSDG